jgi:hypothetical protein
MRKSIDKTEQFLKRLRWKDYFFLNPTEKSTKEAYGFKTRNSPKQVNELKPFEDGILDLIQDITFRDTKCGFLNVLSSDIKTNIRESNRLLVPADKTTNYYAMNTDSYNKLITENMTKTYKRSIDKIVNSIDKQAATIAKQLELDDRIEKLAQKEAFITLKDHKSTFHDHPTCRLINPTKSEIGIVSKHILKEINNAIINATKINMWKNTSSVLKWFNNLEDKDTLSFICFNVCEFYPSINEKLLNNALDFASKHRRISRNVRVIIIHAKRSLLFSDNRPWEKKSSNDLFDVTMGSFDGAETCELVRCYLLSLLTKKYGQHIGLYLDDGLAPFKGTPQEIEKIKKNLCDIFRNNNLKITVDANLSIVNFLDVTLNLKNGKHIPFTKPGNTPLYVHKKSNHPPSIRKNIPESINKRLSELSTDEECFNTAKPAYQDALNRSGYHYNLKFTKTQPKQIRNRQRNIIISYIMTRGKLVIKFPASRGRVC